MVKILVQFESFFHIVPSITKHHFKRSFIGKSAKARRVQHCPVQFNGAIFRTTDFLLQSNVILGKRTLFVMVTCYECALYGPEQVDVMRAEDLSSLIQSLLEMIC